MTAAVADGTFFDFTVTGETSGSTPNGISPLAPGHFYTVAEIPDLTQMNGQAIVGAGYNNCSKVTGTICTTTSATQYVIQTANSSATGTSTLGSATFKPTIIPDTNCAFWKGDSGGFLWQGGSIKVLWSACGFNLFGSVGSVNSPYLEGFPVNGRPTLNAGVVSYGWPWRTVIQSAMTSSAQQAVATDSNGPFVPFYVNDPLDTIPMASGFPFTIFPCDFVSGSTVQSGCAPAGVTKGMFEKITAIGASDGFHTLQRNVGGSTAPSGTPWPSGAIIEMQGLGNNGAVSINNPHDHSMNSGDSFWQAGCADATVQECGDMILGQIQTNFSILSPGTGSTHAVTAEVTINDYAAAITASTVVGDSTINCNSICDISTTGITGTTVGQTIGGYDGQFTNLSPVVMSVQSSDGSFAGLTYVDASRGMRPVSSAAAQVLPLPANGSRIVSPWREKLRINETKAGIGFCVG